MKRKAKFKICKKGSYHVLYRRRWYGWAFEAKSTVRELVVARVHEVWAEEPEYFGC